MPLVTVESSGTGAEASSSLDHAPFTMTTFFGTFLMSCVDAETPACVLAVLPSNGSNTDNATSEKHRAIANRTNYLLNSGCRERRGILGASPLASDSSLIEIAGNREAPAAGSSGDR